MTESRKKPPGQIIAECDALIFDQAAEIRELATVRGKNALLQSRTVADKMYRTIQVKREAEGARLAAMLGNRDPWKSP